MCSEIFSNRFRVCVSLDAGIGRPTLLSAIMLRGKGPEETRRPLLSVYVSAAVVDATDEWSFELQIMQDASILTTTASQLRESENFKNVLKAVLQVLNCSFMSMHMISCCFPKRYDVGGTLVCF